LDEILLFLESKVLGIDIDKVAEPEGIQKTNIDINKYIECIETENKLRKETRLKHTQIKIEFTENLED
jgi:succinyl-CoA synthetase beta subunit